MSPKIWTYLRIPFLKQLCVTFWLNSSKIILMLQCLQIGGMVSLSQPLHHPGGHFTIAWLQRGVNSIPTVPLSAEDKYIHRSNMTFTKLQEGVSIAAIQRTSLWFNRSDCGLEPVNLSCVHKWKEGSWSLKQQSTGDCFFMFAYRYSI